MAIRSTFAGLNTMVSGINANRLSLDTVGNNITNAGTEGYSRQSVNLASTRGQKAASVYGDVIIGTGTDSTSITRARNIYADRQYWRENATENYYTTRQTDYDKLEAVFNDSSDTGISKALQAFYSAWSDLSANASVYSNRVTVVEAGNAFSDKLQTAAKTLQDQITANYQDLSDSVTKINDLTSQIVSLNQNIMLYETNGASANDLRDQRDLLSDELAKYTNLSITENNDTGMYTIVSNGITLVNGQHALTLKISDPITNHKYGVNDFNVEIAESGISFHASNGILKATEDNIAEDKAYIDKLANMAAFLLTDFNDQHRQGAGIDDKSTTDLNFFGDSNTTYTWDADKNCVMGPDGELYGINILDELEINSEISADVNKVAARGWTINSDTGDKELNGTGDGSNAVDISALFNISQSADDTSVRAIGTSSLNSYYNAAMAQLGSDAASMDTSEEAQSNVMTQIENWRSSTSGVNWNEELSNMIMFQQGYSACSRCLTTMDEMLDKLINSTGTVGR